MLGVLACVARQERIRISERVHAGQRRARREGRQLGRPRVVVHGARIQELRSNGASIRAIANELGLSASVVARSVRRLESAA